MDFEEAKALYLEKGNQYLLKALLSHGHTSYVEAKLFKAIEEEQLMLTQAPTPLLEKEGSPTGGVVKTETYESRLLRLEKEWKDAYKRAVFLHNENVVLCSQHMELIKFGHPLPVSVQLNIDANTRQMHALFETTITPLWRQLDELKLLKKLPEEAAADEWPSDPLELIKLRNNYRSYVSRSKKGHSFNDSTEVLEAKLAAIELKLKQLPNAN